MTGYADALTAEQCIRIVAAGLGGWDVSFCPLCDDMIVNHAGNPDMSDHCRSRDDAGHLALLVMET